MAFHTQFIPVCRRVPKPDYSPCSPHLSIPQHIPFHGEYYTLAQAINIVIASTGIVLCMGVFLVKSEEALKRLAITFT
ncbi:hypothetical protein GDO81_005191 [Engystomops pustulosus]|uniref:Uncharacterized protein n=1 Tax=Engystomops pustulosus TaxID=76066 RepID=A0AAV7CLF7_ENGPU|nr:hypothetical protein GDO81_005191 [Engystomops pustulosus]